MNDPFKLKSVALLELLIAIALLSILLLTFASMQIFSNTNVISSDRRTRLQNEVSRALEHMSKNVQRAVGFPGQQPLRPIANGFALYADPLDMEWNATVEDFSDDDIISYVLDGSTHTLSCIIQPVIGSATTEVLSRHIAGGVAQQDHMQVDNPPSGFYIFLDNQNTVIEIGLVTRFDPTNTTVSIGNPQVAMKTRAYTRGSALNP